MYEVFQLLADTSDEQFITLVHGMHTSGVSVSYGSICWNAPTSHLFGKVRQAYEDLITGKTLAPLSLPSAFFCQKEEEYLKQFEDELRAKAFSEDQINRIIIRCQQLRIGQTPDKVLSLEALSSVLRDIMLARAIYAEKIKQVQRPKTPDERLNYLEKEMLALRQQVTLLSCELELQKRNNLRPAEEGNRTYPRPFVSEQQTAPKSQLT